MTHPATAALGRWYRAHRRDLPWRAPPGSLADPYRVWLSEVMLQQTTVATVIGYFERFVARWPTVAALAAADEAEVMRAWAGLGYYARARNLMAAARAVARDHGGRFPSDPQLLRTLPGLGPYTASAVAAIAYGEPATPVDGNIERVVARLFAIDRPVPAAKAEIAAAAARLTPRDHPGDHAQAMMDLGATICTPRSPDCGICPIRDWCAAGPGGFAERLPVKPRKTAVPTRHGAAFWALRPDGAVLMVRRPGRGLLGGTMALPTGAWREVATPWREEVPFAADWRPLPGFVRHVFTHFRLELTVVAAAATGREAIPGDWVAAKAVDQVGMATLFRKAVDHARRHG